MKITKTIHKGHARDCSNISRSIFLHFQTYVHTSPTLRFTDSSARNISTPTFPRKTFPRSTLPRNFFLCSLCKINTFVDLRFLGVWYGCEESCMWVHHRTILVPALGTHTRCVIAPTGQLARAESNSWYTAPAQLPGC